MPLVPICKFVRAGYKLRGLQSSAKPRNTALLVVMKNSKVWERLEC